jgi:hypothetical protein
MKWGVQIPFEDGFMWVTIRESGWPWTLTPLLFESAEEAQEHILKVWPSGKITEYREKNNES